MSDHYILEGKTAVKCSSLMEWATWFDKAERWVARDTIGDSVVSTIFLGCDHSFGDPPLLFETMVFGGALDQEMDRYRTWEEAELGHQNMVDRVRLPLP